MVLGYMCRILWSQHSMKSAQASQAKQENDTIKRSALVPEDCGGLREGRKDRQQSIVKQKR